MQNQLHPRLRHWQDLSDAERTELLIAHGRDLDALAPTCSLEIKRERLQH